MPPAFEVLLLNTAIPQIQAAQSGDTYVVPRDIAINATAIISANSATDALRITQTGAGNAILVEDSANPDSSPFVVTATGDVGIGTTSPTSGFRLDVVGGDFRVSDVASDDGVEIGWSTGGNQGFVQAYDRNASAFRNLNFNGAMTLDTSGNLGLGVTPSAWRSGTPAFQIGSAGVCLFADSGIAGGLGNNMFISSASQYVYLRDDLASRYQQYQGVHSWLTAGSGIANTTTITNGVSYTIITSGNQTAFGAANNNVGTSFTANSSGTLSSGTVSQNIGFSTAMTLDALGNLGVGATSPNFRLEVRGSVVTNGDAIRNMTVISTNSASAGLGGGIAFGGYYNGTTNDINDFAGIQGFKENGTAGDYAGALRFTTRVNGGTPTERARITSGGYFKASNNGTYADSTGGYHEFYQTNNTDTVRVTSTSTAVSGAYGVYVDLTTDPNATDSFFLRCYGGANQRASIRSNGGLANYQANDVNLSDQRVKKDIVAAPSYWDKIKGIEIVHFKYKDQTHDDNNVGVIAQQVEQVAPEFVDQNGWGDTPEDGVPLKSIYTSDMYHAAIKALQEAMARIEKLEAEVAALKGA